MCTTGFNIQKFYFLSAECIYVFCTDLRANSEFSNTAFSGRIFGDDVLWVSDRLFVDDIPLCKYSNLLKRHFFV
jgi:hypothetical protein